MVNILPVPDKTVYFLVNCLFYKNIKVSKQGLSYLSTCFKHFSESLLPSLHLHSVSSILPFHKSNFPSSACYPFSPSLKYPEFPGNSQIIAISSQIRIPILSEQLIIIIYNKIWITGQNKWYPCSPLTGLHLKWENVLI